MTINWWLVAAAGLNIASAIQYATRGGWKMSAVMIAYAVAAAVLATVNV